MKTIKATSKKGMQFIEAFNKADAMLLTEVYGKYSAAKYIAWMHCKEQAINEKGTIMYFRIISHNTFNFSCAWLTADDKLRVETSTNSYIIK